MAAFVSSNYSGSTSSTEVSTTLTTTAGNTVYVAVSSYDSLSAASFSIPGFTKIKSSGTYNGTLVLEIFKKNTYTSSETLIITATTASAVDRINMLAIQISDATGNIAEIDLEPSSVSTNTTWTSVGDITTTASNQLALCAVNSKYTVGGTTGWSSVGYNQTDQSLRVMYKVISSASSVGPITGDLDGSPTSRSYNAIFTAFGDVGWEGQSRVQFIGI